jgi:hypothetical protein
VRFIIPELPYERPLARGLWRYSLDGRPTGAVEQWRLSAAHEGFHFLRIDLDARAAPSGRSYLYHLVLDEDVRAVRLKYRLWQGSRETMGNVSLEVDGALHTRGRGADRHESQLALPPGYRFWFPASSALGLLARDVFSGGQVAAHLALQDESEADTRLTLVQTVVSREQRTLTVDAQGVTAIVDLRWAAQLRTIGLDQTGWPVRMTRQDRLTAEESQLVLYQRITVPGDAQAPRQAG